MADLYTAVPPPPTLFGDPPIFKSPHHNTYAQTHPAHFSTFYAPSDAHLWCAHLGVAISYTKLRACKDAKLWMILGLKANKNRLLFRSTRRMCPEAPYSVIALYIYIYSFTPPLSIHLSLNIPHLHIDKPKFSFSSWTWPHLSPEWAILVNTGILLVFIALTSDPDTVLILLQFCDINS